jgi:hypothetical protein
MDVALQITTLLRNVNALRPKVDRGAPLQSVSGWIAPGRGSISPNGSRTSRIKTAITNAFG